MLCACCVRVHVRVRVWLAALSDMWSVVYATYMAGCCVPPDLTPGSRVVHGGND